MGIGFSHYYEECFYFDMKEESVTDLYNLIENKLMENKSFEIVDDRDLIKVMFQREPLNPDLIQKSNGVIYATWTSSCWSFVDDIVFMIGKDGKENYVYAKSVSRVGKYDFGQNRKHIMSIMQDI